MPQDMSATIIFNGNDQRPPMASLFPLSTSTARTNEMFDALGAGADAECFRVQGKDAIATALRALHTLACDTLGTALMEEISAFEDEVRGIGATTLWFMRH